MKFSNANNAPDPIEFGTIIWYLDKNTQNIIYAIDGEDNKDYYSIDAIKKGILASPEHLSHYDMWFTTNYPFMQVKGFTKLNEGTETDKVPFESKLEEINAKLLKWRGNVLAGKITPDGKEFHTFSACNFKSNRDLNVVFNFFGRKHMLLDDTQFFFNEKKEGSISQLYPEVRTALMNVEATEDAATLHLIDQFKNGTGQDRENAGNQLVEKYENLIRGIWYSAIKARGLHPESPKAEDAYADALYEFLHNIMNFDPTKDLRLSTYVQTSISHILSNYFNKKRNVGENSEINVPHNRSDESENKLSFDRMHQNRESGEEDYDRKEYLSHVLESLQPKLKIIMEKYFYEGQTYEEIGQELGLTKQRIQQLIEKALESIRMNPETQNMQKKVENVKIAMIFNKKV